MIWINAQLSPAVATWLNKQLNIPATALRDLGLRDAEDEEIFAAARTANAIVMTKDSDFLLLLERYGSPPKVILLTCGNTSNASLKSTLLSTIYDALELLHSGEELVEIG